jgi:beta-lactamase regulating signal transducer with metallopeptidase domain
MIWFEYNYIKATEIFNSLKLVLDYSIVEFIVLVIWISIVIWLIFYIFPILDIYFQYRKNLKTKEKNLKLLKKLTVQKEIEEQVAKEVN